MKAILKKIEIAEYNEYMPNRILMFFTRESEELYRFGTTVETQFCTADEYDAREGISEELFDEKVKYAKTLVGKTFEINLYKFTVKDLTDNKYKAFKFKTDIYDDNLPNTVENYLIASYMTEEDVIQNLKFSITKQGIDGLVEGVLLDESTEKITAELFFTKQIPEKKNFIIPYDKYYNLNSKYIVNEIPVNYINKGINLAYQIKERDFPKYEFNRYVHEIEDYRSKVKLAKMENNSLRKMLFFWEPNVVVEELKLSSNIISLMKDCIILGKEYPADCNKADREYTEECEKRLRKRFLGEDVDEKDFKTKWLEFSQALNRKYRGKHVITFSN